MPTLWDLYARCYDTITGLAPYQDMLDDVVAALDLAPGMRVLDAGCGTGVLAERIAASHPDVELVGVDLSSTMLDKARARRAWPASFSHLKADINDVLASDTRGFDRIVSVNVIWTLPDPQGTLARMAAHLRPGGHMVHTTPSWRLRPVVIAWSHLRRQKGWALLRAIVRLPVLLWAGLLNLVLVARTMVGPRAPTASQKWSKEGLVELMHAAGAPAQEIRPCYAGQGFLVRCPLPDPGAHL